MDISKIRPGKYEGMSIFRPPLCSELTGKTFHLVMDDGYDYTLCSCSSQNLTFARVNEAPVHYHYDCLKPEALTYFVNFEGDMCQHPRTGYTLILDTEQSLVTLLLAHLGLDPKLPRMPSAETVFGAILREDGTLPSIRHGYTTDLVGKAIDWCYGTFDIVHVYSSERYYRVTFNPEEFQRLMAEQPRPAAPSGSPAHTRPVYEDLAAYIKIKDGVYAVSLLETLLARQNGQGNSLFFLMNLHAMHDVGRSFGTSAEGTDENYTFGAFGTDFDAADVLAKPSTYYVR